MQPRYDASTGALAVTGSGLLKLNGATNDIDVSKFTFTGEGGDTYTLTDSSDVEITSGPAFTVTLSSTDKAAVNLIVNKNGTASNGGTTYNLDEAIQRLKDAGVEPVLMSGDVKPTAERVAREVGIDRVFAEVRPEDKAAHVKELQDKGFFVAMVGDGINDAPSLAAADVGIAMGGGAEAALGAGAVAITSGDLSALVRGRALARALGRTIRISLAWAFAYNVVALPLAALGALDRLGGAPVAAAAMAGSSIVVVLVALRLGRVRLSR